MKRTKRKPKPQSFTPAQIAAAVGARDTAGPGTPLAILEAFFPDAARIGEITLQPVTLSVLMALQKIKSPLLIASADFAMEDIARATCILTAPIAEVRRLLGERAADGSFPRFDAVVALLADRIAAAEIKPLGVLLNRHLEDAFKNLLPHGVDKATDPDSPFPPARTQGPGTAGS
jgi:hypothetical protein